jgi:hypothetical protein
MFVWVLADVQLSSDTGTVGVASPVVDSVLSEEEVEGAGVVCAAEPQPDASMAIPATVAYSVRRFPRVIPREDMPSAGQMFGWFEVADPGGGLLANGARARKQIDVS